jgi:thiosulfate/3-mercaptopyruvate sulfurtransferase
MSICLYIEKYSFQEQSDARSSDLKSHEKIFTSRSIPYRRLAAILALGRPSRAAAASRQPLVSPGGSTAIDRLELVVLDIRSAIDGSAGALRGHIPGLHSDYDKGGWRVTRNNVPFMVPTTAELEKLIGELGIDENSHVVVVPAGVSVLDFGAAARTYWTLKYAGVAKVSILEAALPPGRRRAWRQARCAVAGDSPRR